MSVSKVIRNPIGTGGDVDLSGHLVALGEIHGGSLVSDDFVNAQGDITTNGNLAVGQTGTFGDLVTIVANNGNPAIEAYAQPATTTQHIQRWRNGAGTVRAVMQGDGTLECLGGFQSGGPILIEPAIGGGIQMMWVENGGVLQRVTGLTALQSIRVNAAGTTVEAYNTVGDTPFLARNNTVPLSTLNSFTIFTPTFDYVILRATIILSGAQTFTLGPKLKFKSTSGDITDVLDMTTIAPTANHYAQIAAKFDAVVVPAGVAVQSEVTVAPTPVGGTTICNAKVILEGFYVT